MANPLDPGLPAISSLFSAPGVVQATLSATPAQTITGGLFKGSVSGSPLATGTNVGIGLAIFVAVPLDPGVTYLVALTLDPASGTWGPPVTVVWQQPAPSQAIVAMDLVQVAWTLPAPTTIASVRASLYDTKAQARIVTGVFDDAGARLTPPIPLSATGTYVLSFIGLNGIASGPEITMPVVLATASIGNVAFTGSAVTGKATAAGASTLDTTALNIGLYANGIPVGVPAQAAADGTFSIPTAGTNGTALTLRAKVSGAVKGINVSGPLSAPVPVLTAAPSIASAALTQTGATTWQIAAAWAPNGGDATGVYAVTLSQSSSALKTWIVDGTSLADVAPSVDSTKALTLTVMAVGNYGNGPASGAATFVPAAVTAVSAQADSETVTATWTVDVSQGTPTAYRLRLLQSLSGGSWITILLGSAIGGTTATLLLPPIATPATTMYALAVDVAVGDAWVSNDVAVSPIVVRAPVITSIAGIAAPGTTPGSATLTWAWPGGTAPSKPVLTGYQPVVLWDGTQTPLAMIPGSATQATIAIPSSIPNGAAIALRAVAAASTGPLGNASPLLFEQPSGATVSYDGATVHASWAHAADARVGAYQVTFSVSGQQPTLETVTGTTWNKAFTPAGNETASVSVAAMAGPAAGPASQAIDVIFRAPSFTGAAFDGTTLTLSWTGVTGATGFFVISVLANGVVTQRIIAGGTTASIPFIAGSLTLAIQAARDSTTGPPSTGVSVLTAAPQVTSADVSATDGSLTVNWGVVAGAGAYNALLRRGTTVAQQWKTAGTSLTVAAGDLPATGVYDLVLQAVGSATSDAISGPLSPAHPVVLIPPAPVATQWDGRTVEVTWDAVRSPQVTGYKTSILNGTTVVASQVSTTPVARIVLTYASTVTFTAVVQPITPSGLGQRSQPVTVFASGWYASTAADKTPYVTPAATQSMAPHDIVVYLPNIFATLVTAGLPATAPFAVARASNAPPFVYTLTIAGTSIAWTFGGEPIRSAVANAYSTLLASLTALGITPMGWRTVQDAIARAMPQTFAETLYYAYGFDPASGYVDLKPGMILRAEFESYQYLGPDRHVSGFVDGFVTSNSAEYEIGSYATDHAWLTGFDAFLSAITQQGTTVPAPPNDGSNYSGGGGIVDLYFAQIRLPFLRLVYPPQILDSGSSDARPAFNVAILAATDYPTLVNATQSLRNARPLGAGAAVTYLRGRTMLSACIRVWIDDAPLTVPVGTTVGNLLESMARRPPVFAATTNPPAAPPGIPLTGVSLTRAIGCAVTDAAMGTTGYAVGGATPVHLNWGGGMAYGAASDWLSLPLLPGDRLSIARSR